MKKLCLVFAITLSLYTLGQEKKAFQVFTRSGQEADYKDILKAAKKADVVLFGEFHNDAIAHWLQLELIKDLKEEKTITIGAEMLEADNQQVVNQYLKGEINQKQLDTLARLWGNYKTDYKPIVDFAKEKGISVVATNIPRKFANMVYKSGFDVLNSLSSQEKTWIAPLPILFNPELPSYKKMQTEMKEHGGENLPKAQAIKDATMAHFILNNIKKETTFIHLNGCYHSDYYEGIYWYLIQKNKDLKIITISVANQKNVMSYEKENINKADYVIAIDEDITKTH